MTDRDLAMLRFAGQRFRFEGAQQDGIRQQFGVSAVRFWQAVNALLDDPAAELAEPQIVHRLRRVRAQRARTSRRLVA